MKKGWFVVRTIKNNDIYNTVYYRDNLISRIWITEDEIIFVTNNITDSFGKNKQENVDYKITIAEFNKLKAHLEEIIGITREKLLEDKNED